MIDAQCNMITVNYVNISKRLWKKRFKAVIVKYLHLDELPKKDISDIVNGELDSWFDKDDTWRHDCPEDAAHENLSYWTE